MSSLKLPPRLSHKSTPCASLVFAGKIQVGYFSTDLVYVIQASKSLNYDAQNGNEPDHRLKPEIEIGIVTLSGRGKHFVVDLQFQDSQVMY